MTNAVNLKKALKKRNANKLLLAIKIKFTVLMTALSQTLDYAKQESTKSEFGATLFGLVGGLIQFAGYIDVGKR